MANIRPERFWDNEMVQLDNHYHRKLKILSTFDIDIHNHTLHEMLAIQKKEMTKCPKYKNCWRQAEETYYDRIGEEEFPALDDGSPEEYHVALICYSTEFYEVFNRRTREISSVKDYQNFPYRSLFYFLLKACENICAGNLSDNQVLYAGKPNRFEATPGRNVVFQQFFSTTRSLEVARKFAKSNGGTIIEIQNLRYGSMCTVLKQHSEYPDEEEVLIWPFEEFKCTHVGKLSRGETHIVLSADW